MRAAPRVPSVAAALLLLLVLTGCDWTQNGFDAANGGANNTESAITLANAPGLHTAWVAPGASGGGTGGVPAWTTDRLAEIATSGSQVLSLDARGTLDAVDAATGAQHWTDPGVTIATSSNLCFPTPARQVETATGLTIVGDLIYGHSEAIVCPLFGYTVSDVTSTVHLGDGTIGDPIVSSHAGPFVAGPDGTIYRVDNGQAVTGGPVDFVGDGTGHVGTPAISGKLLLVPDGAGASRHLSAVDTTTGTIVWSKPSSADFGARPSTDGSRVYSAQAGTVQAFAVSDGTPLWTIGLPGVLDQAGPTIGGNGLVYVESLDHVYALSATSGATVWSAAVPAASSAANRPTVAKGLLYVGSGSQLSVFDAAGTTNCAAQVCTPVATVPLTAEATAPPIVSGGAVYTNAGPDLVKLVP